MEQPLQTEQLESWLNSRFPTSTSGLFLETSGMSGSVAVLADGRLFFEQLTSNARSAQLLPPAIHRGLTAMQTQIEELDVICVTAGPGSFTGLRVGLGLARAMAFSTNKPLLGVSSLESMVLDWAVRQCQDHNHCSSQSPFSESRVHIVSAMNAFRNELFVSAWLFEFHDASFSHQRLTNDERIHRSDLLAYLKKHALESSCSLCSPEPYKFFALDNFTSTAFFQTSPSAIGVAAASLVQLSAATKPPQSRSIDDVLPIYLRGSAAEEKRKQVSS